MPCSVLDEWSRSRELSEMWLWYRVVGGGRWVDVDEADWQTGLTRCWCCFKDPKAQPSPGRVCAPGPRQQAPMSVDAFLLNRHKLTIIIVGTHLTSLRTPLHRSIRHNIIGTASTCLIHRNCSYRILYKSSWPCRIRLDRPPSLCLVFFFFCCCVTRGALSPTEQYQSAKMSDKLTRYGHREMSHATKDKR